MYLYSGPGNYRCNTMHLMLWTQSLVRGGQDVRVMQSYQPSQRSQPSQRNQRCASEKQVVCVSVLDV